jgi:hypothetical protein
VAINKQPTRAGAPSTADSGSRKQVEWLTPTPAGTTVELPWPDADGPFLLTCHLAQIDGRTLLVGLDVRSFRQSGPGAAVPGPRGLVEVNHPALRSLRAGEIAEAARAKLAADLSTQSKSRRASAADRQKAARAYQALTSPAPANPTGQRPPSSQLEKVADLYNQAIATGGDHARRPAIHIYQALTANGAAISISAVRGQIHRARIKGLLINERD